MSPIEIEKSILSWATRFLAKPQAALSGLPACPFAKDVIGGEQLKIEICDDDILIRLEHLAEKFLNLNVRMVVLATTQYQEISSAIVDSHINRLRERFFRNDIWIMSDHPESIEIVEGLKFNHGKLLIFMIQSLTEIVKASDQLHQAGYYRKWPSEYYEVVVARRRQFYQRLLESKLNRDEVSEPL